MIPTLQATRAAAGVGTGDGSAILRAARRHGVPLAPDPVLAEVLSRVDAGDEIPEALFVAIAEVLGFLMGKDGGQEGEPVSEHLLPQ